VTHDHIFKELLRVFFVEFVELFLPDVSEYIDPDSISFLDKELFTDITSDATHEVDLVVQAKFKGKPAFFLIHVENQAKAQANFPERMFRYFARLSETYGLPVFPVVIFSYMTPLSAAPNSYEVAFPGMTVLKFSYRVIQLNRLYWREFLDQPNPVASALMTRMKMAAEERPKVKMECLRLLATLKLTPAKSKIIGVFIENYLKLTAEENRVYERDLAELAPEEREITMEMMTSWHRQGRQEGLQEGRQEGKEDLVIRQIRRRFGEVTATVTKRMDRLSAEQLNELGEALFDFTSIADLEQWLAGH